MNYRRFPWLNDAEVDELEAMDAELQRLEPASTREPPDLAAIDRSLAIIDRRAELLCYQEAARLRLAGGRLTQEGV